MGFFAVAVAYTLRVCLSIALTEMVAPSNRTKGRECPVPNEKNSTSISKEYLYDWDEKTQGLILGSFYWGYPLTHIPAGLLAEKFGGKHCLGVGLLITSVLSLFTPFVIIQSKGNYKLLIVLRFLEGLGSGPMYPAMNAMLANWVPRNERGTIGSLVYAGAQIGIILSNLISGVLIQETKTWSSAFYFFGALGILWFLLWNLLCFSTPASHPFISDDERLRLLLKIKTSSNMGLKNNPTPWIPILTSTPLWALIIAQLGIEWGFYTMIIDLPKYMKDVLKFEVEENGVWSSLTYFVMWVSSMVCGRFCDWVIEKKYVTVTFARKFATIFAGVGPGIFLVSASYAGCDQMLVVALFTIAMGLMGPFYCGLKVNAMDLSPNYAGTLMALTNGIGAFAGVVVPYLVGYLTPNHTLQEWRDVFWMAFGILVATSVIYGFFASGEEQWWNHPPRREFIEDNDT